MLMSLTRRVAGGIGPAKAAAEAAAGFSAGSSAAPRRPCPPVDLSLGGGANQAGNGARGLCVRVRREKL